VAVANTPKPVALEVVAAAMMRKVKLDGGDYIGLVHEHGRINWSMLWELYRKKATGAARNRSGSSGSKSAMDSVDDPLSALLAMPLHARIVAVSKDVRSKADRFGKINAFELAEALKVPQPEMPSGEWTFTSYAEQKSLEEYVDAGGEVSDILDWLVANVSPRRLVTLRKIFGAHIGSAASRSFEFLTSKERRCVEDIIAKRALEANQSNGMNCVASYCVSSGKVQLRFEADVEDDGSCVFLRTPYDERDGRFRDLSNCVIDEW
jgi:hypothetical protein